MLRSYRNELKKLKRQKTVRVAAFIGILLPAFCTILCVNNHYRFRNLVGMNVQFGSFLIAPFLFSVLLLTMFSLEEQNDTWKNILTMGISQSTIFLAKIMAAFTFVLLFSGINTVYTMAGGIVLRNYDPDFGKVFTIFLLASLAAAAGTMPVVWLIVLLRKKYLIAMIAANIFVMFNFILVWQLTMFRCLSLPLPILIAYRIIYPISILEYTDNLRAGLDTLYYPAGKGILILTLTAVSSILLGVWTGKRQEG